VTFPTSTDQRQDNCTPEEWFNKEENFDVHNNETLTLKVTKRDVPVDTQGTSKTVSFLKSRFGISRRGEEQEIKIVPE
jgi:hypothetical protein